MRQKLFFSFFLSKRKTTQNLLQMILSFFSIPYWNFINWRNDAKFSQVLNDAAELFTPRSSCIIIINNCCESSRSFQKRFLFKIVFSFVCWDGDNYFLIINVLFRSRHVYKLGVSVCVLHVVNCNLCKLNIKLACLCYWHFHT